MKAAKFFNAKENDNKFSSYACVVINRKIMAAIHDSHFIRLPVDYFKYFSEMENVKENKEIEEREKNGSEKKTSPSDEDFIEKLNVTPMVLDLIKKNYQSKVFIEDLEDVLERTKVKDEDEKNDVIELTSNNEMKHYLYEKLKELKPNERNVIFCKYFGGESETLYKMSKKIGVSRERIRQLERAALKRLRKKIECDKMWLEMKNRKQ